MPEENTTPTPPPAQPAGGAPTPPPAGDPAQPKPFASLDFKAKAELTLKKNQNINGKGMKAGEAENTARKEMGVELLSDAEVKAMDEKAEKTGGLLDKLWELLGFKKKETAAPANPEKVAQPEAPAATPPADAPAAPATEVPKPETAAPAAPAPQPQTPPASPAAPQADAPAEPASEDKTPPAQPQA